MLLSIFYVISFILIYSGLLFLPRTKKCSSFAVWSVIMLIMVFCLHTAGGILIYNILGLKVGLLSVGIYNVCIGALIWYYIHFKAKCRQAYYIDRTGFVILSGIAVCTLVIGMVRFGLTFNMFRYATSDSSVHLHRVLSIVNTGELTSNRFYLYLVEALVMEVISPVVGAVNYYRIFILCDLFMWFLSAAIFFVLIREYLKDRKMVICGIIFTLLYYFAYPLNNLIYGFNYLGAAVTLAGFILFVTRCFQDESMPRWFAVVAICLGNLSVALCYTQLMPVTFAGSVLFIGASVLTGDKKLSWKKLLVAAFGCVAVGAFGVYYIVIKGYGSLEVLFSNLEGEGPIYRDLWSNIFFFLIFIVIYVKNCIKEKKIEAGYFFLLPLIAYAGYFFLRVCNEQTAAYYFYKFHYLGWIYILYIAFLGLFWSIENYESIYRIYVGIAGVLFVIAMSGIEDKLHTANVWWVPDTKADAYFDIYVWNKDAIVNERTDVSDDMQAMYYVVSQLVEDEQTIVPYLGSWDDYWLKYYYNLTCQEEYYDYFLNVRQSFSSHELDMVNLLEWRVFGQFDNVGYLMVEKESDAHWYGIDYFTQLEPVYENDYGIVYKTGR